MCIHPVQWPGERARLGATSSSHVPAQRGTQLGTAGSNPPPAQSSTSLLGASHTEGRWQVAGMCPPRVPAPMTLAVATLHKVCWCVPSAQVCCNNELRHKHAWALTHTHWSEEPWAAAGGCCLCSMESVVPLSLALCKHTSKPICNGYGDACRNTLCKNIPNSRKKKSKMERFACTYSLHTVKNLFQPAPVPNAPNLTNHSWPLQHLGGHPALGTTSLQGSCNKLWEGCASSGEKSQHRNNTNISPLPSPPSHPGACMLCCYLQLGNPQHWHPRKLLLGACSPHRVWGGSAAVTALFPNRRLSASSGSLLESKLEKSSWNPPRGTKGLLCGRSCRMRLLSLPLPSLLCSVCRRAPAGGSGMGGTCGWADGHEDTQTHGHVGIQARGHADMWTYRHRNTRTLRHMSTLTH